MIRKSVVFLIVLLFLFSATLGQVQTKGKMVKDIGVLSVGPPPSRSIDRSVVDLKVLDKEVTSLPGESCNVSFQVEELRGVNVTLNSVTVQIFSLGMDILHATQDIEDMDIFVPGGSISEHVLQFEIPEDTDLLAARNGDDRLKVKLEYYGVDEKGNGVNGQTWTDLVIPMNVAVLVHSSVKDIVDDRLQRYKEDIVKDNKVEFIEVSKDWDTPESVREDLVSLWENESIIGAVLVGDMPFAMWEIWHTDGSTEPCPIPIFYEDLDATFMDNDSNGFYNKHYWGENDGPEIWVSFIMPPSQTIPSSHLWPAGSSTVGGLKGTYYSDNSFITPVLTRTDSTIEFDWKENGPPSPVPDDDFSIEWEGQVLVDRTDNYTFEIVHGGGLMFDIDGKELIRDEYSPPWNKKTSSCWLDMTAGWHDIRIRYKENGWGDNTGYIRLCWRSEKLVGDIINDWFDKDHTYHTGDMDFPERGLLFMDYPYGGGSLMGTVRTDLLEPIFGSNLDVGGGKNTTNATEYIQNHDMGHEVTSIWSHAGGSSHQFQVDPATGAETTDAPSYKLKDTRGSVVTLIWGCHAGDFADSGYWLSASKTENLAVNYAFETELGLASAGCTRSYGTTFDKVFQDWAEGSYLGLGYFHYLDSGYDKEMRIAEPHPLGEDMWVEDEVLFGDPFIRVDHRPVTPELLIEDGARFGSGDDISVTVVSEGAEEMMFYYRGKYTDWVPFETPYVLPMDLFEGGLEVTVWTRNSYAPSVHSSSDKIYIDGTPPVIERFTINGGELGTNNRTVFLGVSGSDDISGVHQMSFSNDGEEWSEWEDLSGQRTWELSEGDGTKTVYARLRDLAGNIGPTESDSIEIDRTAPSTLIELSGDIGGNGWYTSLVEVRFYPLVEDVLHTYWKIDDEGWSQYLGPILLEDEGLSRVQYRSTDRAGNSEEVKEEMIGIDRSMPYGLSLTTKDSIIYTDRTKVDLVIEAFDDISGVASMCFKEEKDLDWGPWMDLSNDFTYNALCQGSNGIFLKVKDLAGNENSTSYPCKVYSDSERPVLVRSYPEDGGRIDRNGWLSLEFSKWMNLTSSDIVISEVDGPTIEYESIDMTNMGCYFRINAEWKGYSHYTIWISGETRDYLGNSMGKDVLIGFTVNGTAPSAPVNFKGAFENNAVALEWEVPLDSGDLPIVGYRIFRMTSASYWREIGNTAGLSFVDDAVDMGIEYNYRVVPYNDVEDGMSTDEISVEVLEPGVDDDDDGPTEKDDRNDPMLFILVIVLISFLVLVFAGYLLIRKRNVSDEE